MRHKHPYFMYSSITSQPEAFSSVVKSSQALVKQAQQILSSCQRIFLVGTGTSYHAAKAAEYIYRSSISHKNISAVTSIDFALYEESLTSKDLVVVFSHRGTKTYSLKSLQKAKKLDAKTIVITGLDSPIDTQAVDVLIRTVDQEKSSAHTVSYTSALAIAISLVGGPISEISSVLKKSLELEDIVKREALRAKSSKKIWVVGGGPSEITAKEIALKIKETSYTDTEGVGTEELLHGPILSTNPEDFFILIAPNGKAQSRILEYPKVIEALEAKYLMVSDSLSVKEAALLVPEVSEQYTTLSCIIPLQLFSYHLALTKGTDPDSFRLEDPRFAKAASLIKL